jgi:6-phosphofructokinase 2
MVEQLLEREGVPHDPVPIAGLTRENLIVEDEAAGQQFRFNMPGPSLTEAEWESCLDRLARVTPRPDYFVASGSLPPGVPDDFYARTARVAQARGARIIVDTSGEALRLAARSGVFLLKPNIRELRDILQEDIRTEAELKNAAREFIAREQCEVVVVSLGAGGVMTVTRDGVEHLRAPVVPIKSKVGAGDSTVAGIVLALSRGRPIKEAVQYGVAAGAAAVMNPQRELCRREDTETLFGRIVAEGKEAQT